MPDDAAKKEIYEILPEEFPAFLGLRPRPPERLFVQGPLLWKNKDLKFLCVVGSRNHTPYGKEACQKLIEDLAGLPIVIVSGLAFGIDSIAHRAALRAGLLSIGIPGSGLDPKVLYPSNHQRLAREILDAGGMLISELKPDEKAAPWTFPLRNRIMAGMSDGVLLIEGDMKSGSLITAKWAWDYDVTLMVLPGSMFSLRSEGPHYYMKQGAHPVTKAADIISLLGLEKVSEDIKAAKRQRTIDDLSPSERKIYDLIAECRKIPESRDSLLKKSELSATEFNVALSTLELKDIIDPNGDKIILKTDIDFY